MREVQISNDFAGPKALSWDEIDSERYCPLQTVDPCDLVFSTICVLEYMNVLLSWGVRSLINRV